MECLRKEFERQCDMALRFVDLEHAFDTVRREMVVTKVRWMASARSRSQDDGRQCMSEQKEEQWLDMWCQMSFRLMSV